MASFTHPRFINFQTRYSDFDSGYSSVENGDNWGLIFFNETFTKTIMQITEDEQTKDGTIHVYMDNTST